MLSLDCDVVFFKWNITLTSHVPIRKAKGSAGYDLYAAENKTIKSGASDLNQLELYSVIPKWYYGRIVGWSGLVF